MTTDTATISDGVTFRQGVTVQHGDDVVLLTLADRSAFRLRQVGAEICSALYRLAAGAQPLSEVTAGLQLRSAEQLARVLERIAPFLAHSVLWDGRELAAFESTAQVPAYEPVPVGPEVPVRLSEFALLRRREGMLVVESPLATYRCVLKDAAACQVVAGLASASTAARLATPEFPVDAVAGLLGHLAGAGFADLGSTSPDGLHFPVDDDEVLRQWDFHDLYFHSRSRLGRTDEPYGGRFPYVSTIEPQPPVKPAPAGPGIALHRPHLDDVLVRDPSLLVAMEARQSVRAYGAEPVSLDQLGEFLYRTARVRGTYGPRPDRKMPYAGSSRPFPCGGAGYELELYVTVRRCAGLAPGSYFYDPAGHRLFAVDNDSADREALLRLASLSTGGEANPDILITITSRFQRLSWKYQSIAYAVTLKHVGVLYQTMYLVATAMGLAACGLGSGDSDLAARAFGLDYLRESSVGEFLLGSLPAAAPPPETSRGAPDWQPGNDPEWQQAARRLLRGGDDV